MLLHTFEELIGYLKSQNLVRQADSKRQIVEVPSQGAPLPGNLLIKWEKDLPFINIVHFMIEKIPADRLSELESAIARVNNKLELAGFYIDHDSMRLYARLIVPVLPPHGIEATDLNTLGGICVRSGQEFRDTFQAVVDGRPGAEASQIYRALAEKKRAAAGQPSQ
jgi:hypothetical protein